MNSATHGGTECSTFIGANLTNHDAEIGTYCKP